MTIDPRISAIAEEATEWRHDFHAHPELLYDLDRTSARVADLLRQFGCDEVVTGLGRTGVVGLVHGATARVTYGRGYPVTVNHAEQTTFAADTAASLIGDDKVDRELAPMMGAEDFAYMLQERPGSIIFLGNGDSAGLHHPRYDFNDAAIPYGISYWTRLVERALPQSKC